MSQVPVTNSHRRGGIPRPRPESIPLLSYGFRPFFLGAALWACAAMVLWLGLLSGLWSFADSYAAILIAALARVAAPLAPAVYNDVLVLAALGWIVAFGTFILVYGPMLLRARKSG